MGLGNEAEAVMKNSFRDKALNTFVRGLLGYLSRILGIKKPEDLPSALYLFLKLENQSHRTSHANARAQLMDNKQVRKL